MLHRRFPVLLLRSATARLYSAPTVSTVTVGDVLAAREKVFSNLDSAAHGELHPHFEQWQAIRHDAPIHSAVNLMVQRNVGSLIVTQEGQGVVGIVTERDILVKGKETASEGQEMTVKDIMSKRILCIDPSTTIMAALATMNKEKIRHLAVVHADPSQPGTKDVVPIEAMRSVLSIKDIIKAYAEDKKQELTDPSNTAVATESSATSADAGTEESKKDIPATVNASTLLRKKHETINLILNTRVEDNVSVAEAVAEMAKRHFGAVLVMDDGKKIKGIFTERDYLTKVLHPQLDASEVLTKDVCTRNVWTLKSDASLHTCVFEAATRNYHHFPVVDSKEEIVGLLSVKDIVHEIVSEIKPTKGFWLMEYFKKPKPAAPAEKAVEATPIDESKAAGDATTTEDATKATKSA
ncbi:hypothetical protein H310_04552 [Aphanomyces invadans]|uniref:CBS domain-containing protein n=1 Tax=Aphanomyces invadans TaxID=157072 RepID=A0A024UDB8_9STRA|nr:hypothetical protein H310_04552 [Aphanomyces invadans]ETW04210.1 hypothetical protein H310_04552 [Aphanomyces invadans]|eukprot:XP_008867166.1 hypothetical protein H310_04552 [Aphanomyces invadans]